MSLLRGLSGAAGTPEVHSRGIPAAGDPPFLVDTDRPLGIRFYPVRGAFFLPYGLLQSVSWTQEALILQYATDTVTIAGSGLHALFVELAEHRVSRIHADRANPSDGATTEVTEIARLPCV